MSTISITSAIDRSSKIIYNNLLHTIYLLIYIHIYIYDNNIQCQLLTQVRHWRPNNQTLVASSLNNQCIRVLNCTKRAEATNIDDLGRVGEATNRDSAVDMLIGNICDDERTSCRFGQLANYVVLNN
jgi:hypothetical protein